MGTLDELFKKLWDDYKGINKQADGIHQLLESRGEKVINDHIAFRTFNIPELGVDALAEIFVKNGYSPKGEYQFPEKKLFARHYEHANLEYPKIFISELKLEECSHTLRNIIHKLVIQIPSGSTAKWDWCVSGQLWKPIPWESYEKLRDESEYAAWMSVFGFRANHFTVYFNALKTFCDLEGFNIFLKHNGYQLNAAGGEIKGSPKEYLEQSSTLAHPVEVQFADCKKTVPACYYEFARRYPLPDGKIFTGFVAQSANKIFESTDNKKKS